jgi:hypothetical protein
MHYDLHRCKWTKIILSLRIIAKSKMWHISSSRDVTTFTNWPGHYRGRSPFYIEGKWFQHVNVSDAV